MAQDPAFLFYSKDFYEGTRTMLPEERACYIDLMIYQHQNGGFIPNDLKRVKMYCSGVELATLQATLQAKFKLCEKGWYNQKLKTVVEERENFSKKQSVNGLVGVFWKRAYKELSVSDLKKLKSLVTKLCSDNKDFNDNWLSKTTTPKAMLKAMLKHLVNGDVIVNEDVNRDKDEIKKQKEKPKKSENEEIKPEKLIFPFDNTAFLNSWKLWKDFKSNEFGFKYKSSISEQAALKKIAELSNNNYQEAISIINQSIENGWKGFFKLNTATNGKSNNNQPDKEPTINRQTAATIASNLQGWDVE